MKNLLEPSAKSVLMPLGLTAAAAADAAIHTKIFGSGTTTLIISKEEMENITKIVKSLEDSDLLLKSETIQNKAKEKNGGFLAMLLGKLGASLLRNMLVEKGDNIAGDRIIKSWLWIWRIFNQKIFIILPHPLTNLSIIKINLDLMEFILVIT